MTFKVKKKAKIRYSGSLAKQIKGVNYIDFEQQSIDFKSFLTKIFDLAKN